MCTYIYIYIRVYILLFFVRGINSHEPNSGATDGIAAEAHVAADRTEQPDLRRQRAVERVLKQAQCRDAPVAHAAVDACPCGSRKGTIGVTINGVTANIIFVV